MNKGTVKWFNAEKAMALSPVKMERMYLYIFCNQWRGFKSLEEGDGIS